MFPLASWRLCVLAFFVVGPHRLPSSFASSRCSSLAAPQAPTEAILKSALPVRAPMEAWPVPGAAAFLAMAARAFPAGSRVLDVGGDAASAALLQAQAHVRVEPLAPPFLPSLAVPAGSADGVVCPSPTRLGPLIPLLRAFHEALAVEGVALVSDLVWQTAPTPELMRAFSEPGREKVRPIEGYEMQVEHAGFAVVERQDLGPDAWQPFFDADDAKRVALAGDARGAARLSIWVLRKV